MNAKRSIGLVLAGMLLAASADVPSSQAVRALRARLRALGVTVQSLAVNGGMPVVVIGYDPANPPGQSKTDADIVAVFRELAREFPDAEVFRMETFVGPNKTTGLEVGAEEVKALAAGEIDAARFLGKVCVVSNPGAESISTTAARVPVSSKTGSADGDGPPYLLILAGAILVIAAAFILALICTGWRRRR